MCQSNRWNETSPSPFALLTVCVSNTPSLKIRHSPSASASTLSMMPTIYQALVKQPLLRLLILPRSRRIQLTWLASLILFATRPALFLIPALSAMGFTPEVTAFIPLFTMAWVMIVLVVVPSPALLSDLLATS